MDSNTPVIDGAIYFMDYWGIAIGLSPSVSGQAGVIATRSFRKGEMIFPVKGMLVNAPTKYSFAFDRDRHIEPERLNGTFNPGHFLNHSCDPTVIVRPSWEGTVAVIAVVARRDIAVGEELAFDYATLEYDVTAAGVPCLCGSGICRGAIGGFKDLPDDAKARYLEEGGVIAEYLLEM